MTPRIPAANKVAVLFAAVAIGVVGLTASPAGEAVKPTTPMATAANNTATLFAAGILGVIRSSLGGQVASFGSHSSGRPCRHKVKRATLAENKACVGQKS